MGEGFPLWSLAPMAWEGARAPPRLDLSLCLSVSAFSDSALAPFLLYLEIRNSEWIETFAQIFFQKLAFLVAKVEHQPPYKGPMRVGGAPTWSGGVGYPCCHLGHRLALILPPKNHKYFKIILCPFLSRLNSVRYWVSAKYKTCNKQELALGTGSIC